MKEEKDQNDNNEEIKEPSGNTAENNEEVIEASSGETQKEEKVETETADIEEKSESKAETKNEEIKVEEKQEPKKETKKSSNKATIAVVIICLLISIVAIVVCYLVLNDKISFGKKENTESKESKETVVTATPVEAKSEEKDLTKAELTEFEEYIESGKVDLLVAEFAEPEDVKLYMQLQYGEYGDDDLESEELTKQEEIDYFTINKADIEYSLNQGLTIEEYIEEVRDISGDPLKKYSKNSLNKYLKNTLGLTVDDVDLSFMTYMEKYDAYYMGRPSDAFMKEITLLSGKVNSEGLYFIKYEDDYGYEWTLTLKKNGEKYLFVSNVNNLSEKIKEIKNTSDLTVKEGEYNTSYDYKMYYKDKNLYYVEMKDKQMEDFSSTYYFENNKCIAQIMDSYYFEEYYEYTGTVPTELINIFKTEYMK